MEQVEEVTKDNAQLSYEDTKNKLAELIKQKDYLNQNSEIFSILFSGTELNRVQLKAHCFNIIEDKSELATFKSICKAAENEHKQAQKALNRDCAPPFINDNGGVNEGLFTEYCKNEFEYILVRTQGQDNEILYIYENGVYRVVSKNEIKGKILNLLPEDLRSNYIAEAVYKNLLSSSDMEKIKKFDELNIDNSIINLKNGLYRVSTGELIEHSSEYYSSVQLNCAYDITAKCPVFDRYINDLCTMSDGEVDIRAKEAIQEYMGLILSNENIPARVKAALLLVSYEGNTGKTQLINIIELLLGEVNTTSKSIQELSERFATSALYGKRLVTSGDQTNTDIEDSSIFKQITGGDTIFAEKKGKDGFNFKFKGGILIACNGLPYFKDDKGNHIYKRLIIVPCTNVIPEEKRDTELLKKMAAELDGIFLWAMEGLKRLKSNNWVITQSDRMKQAMEEYKTESNTVYAFVKEGFDITLNTKKDRIKVSDFYNRYSVWCDDSGHMPVSKKNISKRMESLGITKGPYDGYTCFKGIKAKSFVDDGTVEPNDIENIFGKSG